MHETEAYTFEVDTTPERGDSGTTSEYRSCIGAYRMLGTYWTGEHQSCERLYLAIIVSPGNEGTTYMAPSSLRLSVRTSLASDNGSQESSPQLRDTRLPQGRPYPKSFTIKAGVHRLPQVPILRARRPDISRCREYC